MTDPYTISSLNEKENLRQDWRMMKFGDIAENVAVRVEPAEAQTDAYVGLEHLAPETLHLRKWGHPSDVTGQKLAFEKGDVIFGRRRAYQRKLAVAEFEGICSAHAMVVRAKPEKILPEFLPFFLQSDMFMERAIEISVGSLSPTINWKTLRVQELPLPPIEEQKRIAEILWAADDAVEKYLSACTRLASLKKTMVQQAARSNGSWLPISEVAAKITSGSRGWAKYYADSGGKFVRITNLVRGSVRVDLSDLQHVTAPQTLESGRTRISPGDLLISITAELGLIGVANQSLGEAYVNQHIAKVTLDQAKYDSLFAGYFLTDKLGQGQFVRLNDQGAKAGMNLKNVAKLKLPNIPLSKQKTLVKSFAELDDQEEALLRHVGSLRGMSKVIRNGLVTPDMRIEAHV